MTNRPISELLNIGVTVSLRLKEIGISDEKKLRKVGSAKAYKQLSKKHPDKHLPVCYYLYSLEGAIKNKHWNDLSEREKAKLRKDAGLKK